MKTGYLKKVLSLGLGLAAIGSLVFVSAGHAAKGIIRSNNGSTSNFKVEIDGVTMAGVQAVTGIESEIEVIEYQDGDDMTIRKRPGRTKYSNIVLKRGLAQNNDLWQWYQETIKGKNIRKNISVIIYKKDGSEGLRYNFFEAWPCRWQGASIGDPDFDLLRVVHGDPDFDLSTIGVVHGDPDFDLMTEKISFCVNGMTRK